jgi:hypothetical protein
MNTSQKAGRSRSRQLRDAIAAAVTLIGLLMIAALWMRELNGPALLDALFGSVYLFVGIGLFGQSRFTLFVAMGITAGSIALLYTGDSALEILERARLLLELIIFITCTGLLFTASKD